jgi:TPR repeat protein
MCTLGLYYMHDPEHRNLTKALPYLLKAAAQHSDDAHFSLGVLYREGSPEVPRDVPRGVAHMAVAASWGHVRSLNYLAHALYDGDSWLAQYGREQQRARRNEAMMEALVGSAVVVPSPEKAVPPVTKVGTSAAAGAARVNATIGNSSSSNATATPSSSAPKTPAAAVAPPASTTNLTDALLRSITGARSIADPELLKIYLPDGAIVPLPYPLGSPDGRSLDP